MCTALANNLSYSPTKVKYVSDSSLKGSSFLVAQTLARKNENGSNEAPPKFGLLSSQPKGAMEVA